MSAADRISAMTTSRKPDRKAVKTTALALALVAAAVYVGFIIYSAIIL